VAEVRRLGVAFELALLPDMDLVLQDEFQKLGVTEPVGGGFLKPDAQGLAQAGEAEFLSGWFRDWHVSMVSLLVLG